MIPFTASDFMVCLSEIQSPNALRTSIFRQVCGALFKFMNNFNPRRHKGGGGGQSDPPSIFLAFNFYSLINYQNLWHNCSLFVKTSFDSN